MQTKCLKPKGNGNPVRQIWSWYLHTPGHISQVSKRPVSDKAISSVGQIDDVLEFLKIFPIWAFEHIWDIQTFGCLSWVLENAEMSPQHFYNCIFEYLIYFLLVL